MDQLIVIVNNDGLIRELFIMMVRKSGFQISQKFGFPISQIFGFPYYSEICFSDLPDIQFSGKPNYPVFRFCRLSGKASLRPIHLLIAVTGYRYLNNWIFQNSTLIFTKNFIFPVHYVHDSCQPVLLYDPVLFQICTRRTGSGCMRWPTRCPNHRPAPPVRTPPSQRPCRHQWVSGTPHAPPVRTPPSWRLCRGQWVCGAPFFNFLSCTPCLDTPILAAVSPPMGMRSAFFTFQRQFCRQWACGAPFLHVSGSFAAN